MSFFKSSRPSYIKKYLKESAKWSPFEIGRYKLLYDEIIANSKTAEPRKLGIKLIVVSDTHGQLAFDRSRFLSFLKSVKEYDLCLILGDIYPEEIDVILEHIPRQKIIAIKGNHDSFDIYGKYKIRDISGCIYSYNGVQFAGIDGSFRYKNEPFPSHTQRESLKIADGLKKADVLLTHDVMLADFGRDPAHSGLIGIAYYIYEKTPLWHFHGHIHKSYEQRYKNGTREKSVYMWEYVEL